MKTIAEEWNNKARRPLFATETDEYGCPAGGWAVPIFTVRVDAKNGLVHISCGTFRLEDGRAVGEKVEGQAPYYEVDWQANSPLPSAIAEQLRHDLIERLVDLYDKEHGTDEAENQHANGATI